LMGEFGKCSHFLPRFHIDLTGFENLSGLLIVFNYQFIKFRDGLTVSPAIVF